MTLMTGGEAVVRSLLAHGLDTLFCLPGVQNDWLFNALFDAGARVHVIHTRHEPGAGYMALGASLVRGDIAVCNVVPGPGILNAGSPWALRRALRNGTVWIDHGLAFRSRERLFIPTETWQKERNSYYRRLSLSKRAEVYLVPLIERARAGVAAVAKAVEAGELRVDDEMHLTSLGGRGGGAGTGQVARRVPTRNC